MFIKTLTNLDQQLLPRLLALRRVAVLGEDTTIGEKAGRLGQVAGRADKVEDAVRQRPDEQTRALGGAAVGFMVRHVADLATRRLHALGELLQLHSVVNPLVAFKNQNHRARVNQIGPEIVVWMNTMNHWLTTPACHAGGPVDSAAQVGLRRTPVPRRLTKFVLCRH